MNKKLVFIILTLCIVLTCALALSACGSSNPAPQFYNKTFVLEKLTVDYSSKINDIELGTILEDNMSHIDWKSTIQANSSTIDHTTFEEEVATLDRAKEIIDTFGKDMFGMKIAFDSQDAKTATMTMGSATEQIVVEDSDNQGANAALKSSKGEEFARISLNYNDSSSEIVNLQFWFSSSRDLTICFDEEVQLFGSSMTSFTFAPEYFFTLQA